MIHLDLIHLAATAGFCALLWVVQLVVYPQMATVREEDFKDYHHRHTRAIGWIVAPLFLAEGTCAAISFWLGWRAEPWGAVGLGWAFCRKQPADVSVVRSGAHAALTWER